MQIKVEQIPHRYRNRFLRDANGSVTVTKSTTQSNGVASFKPVNIWGRYFDDTEDISGDLNNVGSITADGDLNVFGDCTFDYVKTADIEPKQGEIYNLGSAAKKWKKVFASAIDCQDASTQNLSADNASVCKMYVDASLIVGGEEINVTDLYSELQALRDLILDVSTRVPIQSNNQ